MRDLCSSIRGYISPPKKEAGGHRLSNVARRRRACVTSQYALAVVAALKPEHFFCPSVVWNKLTIGEFMRKVFFSLLVIAIFAATTGLKPSGASQLNGNWGGEFLGTTNTVPFQIHFWTENGEIKGTIDFPQENLYGLELSWIILESQSVHFEVVKNSETLAFQGKLIENKLIGEFSTKTGRGLFDLSRLS